MTTHTTYTLSASTQTAITPPGTHSGMDITIQNVTPSGNIYVGGEGVTATNYGYKLMPNHAISFELPGSDSLYLIADNAESQAAVIQIELEAQN